MYSTQEKQKIAVIAVNNVVFLHYICSKCNSKCN